MADFRATRPGTESAEWTLTQLSGADWGNLGSFINPRISAEDARFAMVEIYNAELNARYTTPLHLPTFFKLGAKINEEYRQSENRTVYHTYAYVGPGGGPTGSFASFPSPRAFSRRFGDIDALTLSNPPVMVNRIALGELFRSHPEYFENNATPDNYYNAFYANKRDFKQTVTAAYGLANTRVGPVQLQGGLRWERTETNAKEFNPIPAAQVLAAGFPVLVQQNEISNLRVTRRFTAEDFGYEDDPAYAGYMFESLGNSEGLYRYRNLEFGYDQQLSFLPGFLRSTNVNLSYTRSYANLWRPGVVPRKATGGIAWNYQRVNLRLGAVWNDDAPFTTVFGRYQRHNIKVDLSGGFRLTPRVNVFFQGRNILNEPQLLYEGDPGANVPAALYRYGNYGVSWVFGVKGNF